MNYMCIYIHVLVHVFLLLQFEGENAALSNMNTYLVQAFEQFK